MFARRPFLRFKGKRFFNFFLKRFGGLDNSPYLCTRKTREAPARESLSGGLLKFSAPGLGAGRRSLTD